MIAYTAVYCAIYMESCRPSGAAGARRNAKTLLARDSPSLRTGPGLWAQWPQWPQRPSGRCRAPLKTLRCLHPRARSPTDLARSTRDSYEMCRLSPDCMRQDFWSVSERPDSPHARPCRGGSSRACCHSSAWLNSRERCQGRGTPPCRRPRRYVRQRRRAFRSR